MEPITTAIIAVLASGMTKAGEKAIMDSYESLKSLIKRKFGAQSSVAKAVDELEAKPDSAGRKETLKEEVTAVKAEQDADLLQAAQLLLEKLKAQPGGAQIIQQASGSYIAQASGTSTATVNVSVPKP